AFVERGPDLPGVARVAGLELKSCVVRCAVLLHAEAGRAVADRAVRVDCPLLARFPGAAVARVEVQRISYRVLVPAGSIEAKALCAQRFRRRVVGALLLRRTGTSRDVSQRARRRAPTRIIKTHARRAVLV